MENKVKQGRIKKSDIKLTLGEKLLLHRRILGLSQTKAAEVFGLSYHQYRLLEYDIETSVDIEFPKRDPELYEICFILRRRSKISQKYVADKIGVSRWWLIRQELGQVNCKRLCEFWKIDGDSK